MTAATEPASARLLLLKLVMGLGLLGDAGLAILLIAISGFVFGGPEGANGEASAVIAWSSALAVTVIAPALSLFMWRRGRRDHAIALTWLPPLGLLVGALFAF